MAGLLDIVRVLVEITLLSLALLRSLGPCSFLFVSINATVFIRSSTHTQPSGGGEASCSSIRKGPPRLRSRKTDENEDVARNEASRAFRTQRDTNSLPSSPNARSQSKIARPLSSSPKLASATKAHPGDPPSKPGFGSITKLYESIIASDAETIQVQQATIQSSQEIIRSQRDMIAKLRQVVEAQDAWIEEHMQGQDLGMPE